jgi:hypothetical protein
MVYNNETKKYKIVFTDPCIWICDTSWWSGWFAQFDWKIELPFNINNIIVWEQWPWYSLMQVYWINEIGDSWYEIKETRSKKEIQTNPDIERYSKWDKDLKQGICNSDDPRRESHKFEYFNEPMNCRWQCSICWRVIMD